MMDDYNIPMRRITTEAFEAMLLEIRNGVTMSLRESALQGSEALTEDARDVWHATEIALGMLSPNYFPKREAMEDVRQLLQKYDKEEGTS